MPLLGFFAEGSSLHVEALLGRFVGLPPPCRTTRAILPTFMHSTMVHLAACRPPPTWTVRCFFLLNSAVSFALFPSSRFSGSSSFKSLVSACILFYNRMVVAGGDCLSFFAQRARCNRPVRRSFARSDHISYSRLSRHLRNADYQQRP